MEKTIIMVRHGKVKEIAKVFGISKTAVSLALRGHRKNDLTKKIRHVALTQFDGVEMQQVKKESKK